MGWSAWALDNLWLVAGGTLLLSFALHFAVTWLFKNSGKAVKVEHSATETKEK